MIAASHDVTFFFDEKTGEKKEALIVFLHGWGVDGTYFSGITKMLSNRGYGSLSVDLPGFGKSEMPHRILGPNDYADIIHDWLQKRAVPYVLVGHSFGGQIAALIASKHPDELLGLILMGAAVIRRQKSFRSQIFEKFAKLGKKLLSFPILRIFAPFFEKLLYRMAKTSDYMKAPLIMKEIMKKTISYDARSMAKKIETPTLLIWGDRDRSTPIKDAYGLLRIIKKSRLEVIECQGHDIPRTCASDVAGLIVDFIKNTVSI